MARLGGPAPLLRYARSCQGIGNGQDVAQVAGSQVASPAVCVLFDVSQSIVSQGTRSTMVCLS